ncbi:class I SAM-dependent methyltransferase [Flavobacteriaceae bacterium R38]|nr:class I SAM-dependent methyltransferase [Flavobacteriaceae bacterium R38]
MWHLIKAYFSFIVKSTNQHDVHSPFVYDLVTKCFYNNKKQEAYTTLSAYKNQLLDNHDHIKVSDFGAGSRVFKSDKRKVSAIAKNAGISLKRGQLLNRLVKYLNATAILELGTSVGIGTAAMAIDNKEVKITTVEGCPETAKVAKNHFNSFHLDHIKLINDTFENALPTLTDQIFDIVYVDGNHQKEATLRYFNQLLKHRHNNTVFIFDDIHWSAEMEAAWKTIKKHPEVSVTIDTFQWGFVFFRKEQVKEDFVIRI